MFTAYDFLHNNTSTNNILFLQFATSTALVYMRFE